MRLSCNFVNVYKIAYRVQYTFTRVHAWYLTDILARILARKSARVGQVGGLVGEDRRACSARGKLAERGSRRTRRLAREDPRAEVSDDVRVSVSVGVGPMEFKL